MAQLLVNSQHRQPPKKKAAWIIPNVSWEQQYTL